MKSMSRTITAIVMLFFFKTFLSSSTDYRVPMIHKLKPYFAEKAEPMDKYIHDEFQVVGTYYNPLMSQCAGNPLVTADGSKIDLKALKNKEIRWVALSRDLLKRWGGHFDYGDTIYASHDSEDIRGFWIVKDCMNARFTNKIDFLVHVDNKFIGKAKGVDIYKK